MIAWATVVTFGVPERCVDALIERLHGSAAEPGRWLVFGHDMNLLRAIHEHWNSATDITIALLPATDAMLVDVAVDIASHEGMALNRCAWVHGSGVDGAPPRSLGLIIDAADKDAAAIAVALAAAVPNSGHNA